MIRTSLLLFLALYFVCAPDLTAQSYSYADTTVIMDDGIALDALYAVPDGQPPSDGWPAVLFVHGFGGSKNNMKSYALKYASQGYATAAYSVRGQGSSGGYFSMFTSPRILDDLRAMIAFTASLPHVNPGRVGVGGASQGGLHAWSAVAFGMNVRTVVSIVANGRFDENWVENDAINWIFGNSILYGNVRFAPGWSDSVKAAISGGDVPYVRDLLNKYKTTSLESGVTTPVLMMDSYYDQYFNPTSAIRQFAAIPGPKRIMMYPGGHDVPSNAAANAYFENLYERWFDYWLKDDPSMADVLSPDSAVLMLDGATWQPHVFSLADSSIWGEAPVTSSSGISMMRLYFDAASNALVPAAPSQSTWASTNFTVGAGSSSMTFRSQPMPQDVVLCGTKGAAVLEMNGSGSIYQACLTVSDIDPTTNASLPVTRGHYEVYSNQAGRESMTMRLNNCIHTIKAGHLIEVRIHGGVAFLPNFTYDFGNVTMGPTVSSDDTLFTGGSSSYIEMPVYTSIPASVYDHVIPDPSSAIGAVYPNPVGGASGSTHASIIATVRSSSARVAVYDMLGRTVYEARGFANGPGTYTVTFDTRVLPAGSYNAVLIDGNAVSTRAIRHLGIAR
jgi:predicted acyl esterase